MSASSRAALERLRSIADIIIPAGNPLCCWLGDEATLPARIAEASMIRDAPADRIEVINVMGGRMNRYSNSRRNAKAAQDNLQWTSVVRIVTLPNGTSVVVLTENASALLDALLGHDVGHEGDLAIYRAAADQGCLLELGAIDGLLDAVHRMRAELNMEIS
ncbi:MAG: hypothetical protein IPN24_18440 [Betaproteobacteria bacterium]|nr:hypothetical protein [Betaproteobacteria bacterium]